MIVLAVGISFGANAGYAINPARDFGPRMFALIAGWGKIAFPGNYGNVNDYFWIPIVGPLIGGAVASVVYDRGVRDILKARFEPSRASRLRARPSGRTARQPIDRNRLRPTSSRARHRHSGAERKTHA